MFKFKKIKLKKEEDPYFLIDFYAPQLNETKTVRIVSDSEEDLNNYLSNYELEKNKLDLKKVPLQSNYITTGIKIKENYYPISYPFKLNKIKKENIKILSDKELEEKLEKKINDLAINKAQKISIFFKTKDSERLIKNYVEGERNNLNRLIDILFKDFKYKNYLEVEKKLEEEKSIKKFLEDILIIQRTDFEKEKSEIIKNQEIYKEEKETTTAEFVELLDNELKEVKYFDEEGTEYKIEVIKISEMIEKF